MSFLQVGRRRSARPLRDTTTTFDPTSSGDSTPSNEKEERGRDKPLPATWRGPSTPKDSPTSSGFRKRLSSFTLLTPKRSQGTTFSNGSGIGFVASGRGSPYIRSRSPSPTPSLTIRLPSGLGRRASRKALPLEPRDDQSPVAFPIHHLPVPVLVKRSVSTPDLLSNTYIAQAIPVEEFQPWENASSSEDDEVEPERKQPTFDFARMSPELLKTVFSDASKKDLASLALVCQSFILPVRKVLYSNLDLRNIKDTSRVEQCIALLASRRDIAELVRSFACLIAPSDRESTSPLFLVSFAIALTNMRQLHSLTLPTFVNHLLYHSTFQLKTLTFLCDTLSQNECQDMLSWLSSQSAIVSLSLPNLALTALPSSLSLTATGLSASTKTANGSPIPSAPPSPISDIDAPGSVFPSSFLPKLSFFHGPASLAAALVPGRPIRSLHLHIHTTIYDGLRPSALMSALVSSSVPIKHLAIKATLRNRVDARTFERVLMSAGAELGGQIELLDIDWILEDEILYKNLVSILPRFHALHTLRLHRRSPPPPPRSPPPSTSLPPPTPTTPTTSSIRSSLYLPNGRATIFAYSPSPTTPPPSPLIRGRSSTSNSNSKRYSLDIPLSRAHERTHLASWNKQCGSLKWVTFLSGAEWKIGMGVSVGDTIGAPIFTHLGTVRS